jgi:xylan 1,4-beta-xylosidase
MPTSLIKKLLIVGMVSSCWLLFCVCKGKTMPEPTKPASETQSVYQNPILPGFHPDPSICRVGSDYYLVTSSFEYFPGVPIFHSRDLIHWKHIGHCLTRPSQLPLQKAGSSRGIFAPTLRYHSGTYFMVTTNVSGGGNFYVTANDPAGKWSEPVWLQEKSGGIDPSFFFDDDGKVYFTRQGNGERGGVFQCEYDLNNKKLLDVPKMIWAGTGGIWPEGPHLYKIDKTYYLMIAEGGTSYGHMETIARSPSPWGPFEPCPHNPILTHKNRPGHPIQATGHADLVQAKDKSWWLVFLGVRPHGGNFHHLGRETFLAPVTWDNDGWPVVNENGTVELNMSAPLISSYPWKADPTRDDFNSGALNLCWNFLRNPDEGNWTLSDRSGWMRVKGTLISLDDEDTPAFVGRRQEHFKCKVSTLMEFNPREEGQEAGLVVRANEKYHYDLVVSKEKGKRQIIFRTRVNGESKIKNQKVLEDGLVTLCVEAKEDQYEFFYSPPDKPLQSLGTAPTKELSTEVAGGFTGVYFGMYATHTSSGPMPPADFDWFEYVPEESASK